MQTMILLWVTIRTNWNEEVITINMQRTLMFYVHKEEAMNKQYFDISGRKGKDAFELLGEQ